MTRKILIVDDNPDDIEITKVALEEKAWDVEVETYTRAEVALDRLQETADLPSWILLDINLPDMSGLNCVRQIRANERLISVPIIITTNSSYSTDKKKACDAGADLFLFKDLDFDKYAESLDTALKRFMV
ncbi:MAG: Transcriptional regulatory protein KdpE [Syntrophus sp. SKADARSKE-3]|nr:Transcriptional regulatory protein KdpE [Syntrophus sp. SKADARSKE-3]